jgi:hypothetical protein
MLLANGLDAGPYTVKSDAGKALGVVLPRRSGLACRRCGRGDEVLFGPNDLLDGGPGAVLACESCWNAIHFDLVRMFSQVETGQDGLGGFVPPPVSPP